MPYINQEIRKIFDQTIEKLAPATDGELNYIITRLLLRTGPRSYQDYNALIGVLECVKLEFYRRAVAVYEDKKKEENGDVFETDCA